MKHSLQSALAAKMVTKSKKGSMAKADDDMEPKKKLNVKGFSPEDIAQAIHAKRMASGGLVEGEMPEDASDDVLMPDQDEADDFLTEGDDDGMESYGAPVDGIERPEEEDTGRRRKMLDMIMYRHKIK